MTQSFLDRMYDAPGSIDAVTVYDDWAASYDRELTEAGYVTPDRCARVLAELAPDMAAPVLDLGCGTGLSGMALRQAGFTTVDGADVSAEMLARAGRHPGLYRALTHIDPGAPLPIAPGTYAHIFAAGVISPDHAPPQTIATALGLLPAGGVLVFSLNDHALSVPEFPGAVDAAVGEGLALLEHAEHGDHIPKIGLKATVFALSKA